MANVGKVEGLITVPSGGWDITGVADDGLSGQTINIPAGVWYLSSAAVGGDGNDFLTTIEGYINTTMTESWSASTPAWRHTALTLSVSKRRPPCRW